MKRISTKRLGACFIAMVVVVVLLGPPAAISGSLKEGAKKADQGINTAGQKVDSSTKGVQNTADTIGKKTSAATKSGADKVGGFLKKTETSVEGWLKGFEKKGK